MRFVGKGTRAGVLAAATPVVPGPDPLVVEDCAACGYGTHHGVLRVRQVVDGVDMVLCLDPVTCSERVRAGASPESYAAGLRGEILAVAP